MSINIFAPKARLGVLDTFRNGADRVFPRFYQTQSLPGNLFYVGIGLDILQFVLEGLVFGLQSLYLLLHSPDLRFHPGQLKKLPTQGKKEIAHHGRRKQNGQPARRKAPDTAVTLIIRPAP
ncbi:MAG: hypothetical protein M0Z41_11960 [Peptococcaceae bacterium]|jgi:hypothetical protein|nr:hypothetical protein [Peptococcaceae bacterium]